MPGVGPAPKDPATRRRRNKPAAPTAVVTSDGELRGPDLPDLGGDEAWQAQVFTETDWDFLIDTALMHTVMWSKGKWEFASEVRLRGAKLGATKDDRKRLGIDVVVPAAKSGNQTGGNVTEIASRRRLLDEG
jgi:hypothetical protein